MAEVESPIDLLLSPGDDMHGGFDMMEEDAVPAAADALMAGSDSDGLMSTDPESPGSGDALASPGQPTKPQEPIAKNPKPVKPVALKKAPVDKTPKRTREGPPSPNRMRKSNNDWNPHLKKQDDTSLALRKDPQSPGRLRSSSNVTSPSKEERDKRKAWAEAASKRQAEAAKRLQALEEAARVELDKRLETRRQQVRQRIEQEKEAHARLVAKRAAATGKPGEGSPGNTMDRDDPRLMSKRSASPRPLYIRLAEQYEQKQKAEEDEIKRKLEMHTAIRQVRVQALMNGEVIIRPMPDEIKQPKEVPRWNPAGRAHSASPGRTSPHRSRNGSVNGDDGPASTAGSPQRKLHEEGNGMVLYSMHDGEDGADGQGLGSGTGQRKGRLNIRREHGNTAGNQQRFNGASRRMALVDRASSPFVLDPASLQPTNVPDQEQFWKGGSKPAAQPASASSTKRLGALEQEPPPPPIKSTKSAKQPQPEASAIEAEHSQATLLADDGDLPNAQELAQVLGPEESELQLPQEPEAAPEPEQEPEPEPEPEAAAAEEAAAPEPAAEEAAAPEAAAEEAAPADADEASNEVTPEAAAAAEE